MRVVDARKSTVVLAARRPRSVSPRSLFRLSTVAAFAVLVSAQNASAQRQHTGQLVVMSEPPGGIVFVDGTRVGLAPQRVADLLRGEHLVVVVFGHGQRLERAVSVVVGESRVVQMAAPSASAASESGPVAPSGTPPISASPPAAVAASAAPGGASEARRDQPVAPAITGGVSSSPPPSAAAPIPPTIEATAQTSSSAPTPQAFAPAPPAVASPSGVTQGELVRPESSAINDARPGSMPAEITASTPSDRRPEFVAPRGPERHRRPAVLAVAGVGAVLIAVGAVSWAVSDSSFGVLRNECASSGCSPYQYNATRNTVNTLDAVSSVTIIGGALVAVVGTALFIFWKSPDERRVVPIVNPALGTLGVAGRF